MNTRSAENPEPASGEHDGMAHGARTGRGMGGGTGQGPGSAMNHGEGHGPGMGHGRHSQLRHHHVMREGLPETYASLSNPLEADDASIAAGRQVYASYCATCHGTTGEGDGPAGATLDPQPSYLRQLPRMPAVSSDAYLYWTIAEGGTPLGSAMPAFEAALEPDEIWSVILFLREGLQTSPR